MTRIPAGRLALMLGVLTFWLGPFGAVAAQPLRILAFGDSLTHGYGLAAGETFPQRLEAVLRAEGYAVTVSNGGNSGDTTAAGRARLDWILAERPEIAIVELGGNDGLRGLHPSETYANLDAILTRFRADGVAVLLAGMRAPRNLGRTYTEAFDAVFPALADKYDIAFYPFFLDGVAFDPALNQPDGIHPNAAGAQRIAERIAPSVIGVIDALDRSVHRVDGPVAGD